MTYTQDHFKNCQFNPFDERLFYTHPKLSQIVPKKIPDEDSVLDRLPHYKVCRYIIALYDTKSPLIKGEQNLIRRKEIAAEIAGFDIDKQTDDLQILYECRDVRFAQFIQNYLKDFAKSMEWAMIHSFEQAFWEYQARLMQPIEKDGKDRDIIAAISMKTKLSEDIGDMYDKYQAALDKFYGEDKEIIEQAGKIRSFTPEQIHKLKVK